ncbi:MAG: valine--tRNA ligase, partial [Proteobacteria bacterium]|nr:valine--tRNA ligase [Pseudomonadota bacterium]
EDERYKAMIGKQVKLPITGRLIPVIGDEHADPSLGTGAVKITPGHDFNDFEVGKRVGMKAGEMLNMLDARAQVTQTADGLIPGDLLGVDRFWARKLVVEKLKAEGFLVPFVDKEGVEHDAEPRSIQTPYGDRSGDVIEPWLTDQWYVDAATLAKAPIEAVKSGAIKIVPKSWEKTFFNWMENIQPWCVSRQLWWGHRIPALHGPTKEGDRLTFSRTPKGQSQSASSQEFVAETPEERIKLAEAFYGKPVRIAADRDSAMTGAMLVAAKLEEDVVPVWEDEDVLDTWFSSALWPFATMGWPEDGEWQHRYPNDVLISGFDILFFWDARMMMQGMHFMGDVPFRTLYLHGLVRAADGQKMSKSKGNVVNPLGLIDRYGADALRFFMAAMESQGRDIKMDEKRVEGYRNFATKLWNAARFCQANGIGASKTLEPPEATLAVNKWIIGETIQTVQAVDLALADYRFDGAANAVYQFAWSRFCDWYLELIKPILSVRAELVEARDAEHALRQAQGERGEIEETRAVSGWVLDQILVMLHPFMPFVTEELWSKLGEREYDLIVAKWPMADARAIDPEAGREIDWLIRLVSEVRSSRTELNVPPGARLAVHLRDASAETLARFERQRPSIERLARIDLAVGDIPAGGAAQVVVDEATFVLPLEGVIDLDAERARLTKAIKAAAKECDSLAGRLNNASFVERAKPEAVEKARADHAEKSAEAERLTAALARLG